MRKRTTIRLFSVELFSDVAIGWIEKWVAMH
jgi:hypothetical protein